MVKPDAMGTNVTPILLDVADRIACEKCGIVQWVRKYRQPRWCDGCKSDRNNIQEYRTLRAAIQAANRPPAPKHSRDQQRALFAVRALKIYRNYRKGASLKAIATANNISYARVNQILIEGSRRQLFEYPLPRSAKAK